MSQIMLVTGTRKGIGKGMALYYLDRGWTVAGCSRRGPTIEHERYHHYELDVADERAVVSMVRGVVKTLGSIDVLINNAGTASMNHILLTPGKTVRRLFETNFAGSFFFLREVAKTMARSKAGRIVNLSTVAAPLDLEGEAVYASTKAAVEKLTRVAAREFGGLGITVNALGPTPVQTDLIKLVPKEKIDGLLARQAIKRFGELDDISNAIDFFISPGSGFITGQVLYLGGVVD